MLQTLTLKAQKLPQVIKTKGITGIAKSSCATVFMQILFIFLKLLNLDNKEQIDRLTAEVTELKTKNEDILDKYRRSIAENDNMRKRLTKQIEDAKIYGIQGFCKDLLDVANVLGKAVEAGEQTTNVEDMVQGLK